MTPTAQRTLILTLLAALMAATRINHFAPVPDASWAVFFLGGVYLSAWTRWAFPLLMALAVAVDYAVISSTGTNFWQHYCVSPAYWCLVPAYFSMWAGGMWLRSRGIALNLRTLGLAGASLVTAAAVCQLIAQGSFYWVSASVASPTLAGWWQNYIDWLPGYLTTASAYVAVAAVVHVAATSLARGGADAVATR
ncbi:hypothetical protein [Cognatilysobacter lacus]|uniref:Cobalamin ABC transporter n=1 Tax=Cognatilysobacter lacus TaxID=1643323 RepID=A0A5D8YY22_9GAMM|nr:hypothetical protein [Lysobacter lacus]TZF87136.1 hypothetical protein FW784_11540 [Lysobacter lacus]